MDNQVNDGSIAMAYETENAFMSDPLGFLENNVIWPVFPGDKQSGTYGVALKPANASTYGITKRGKHKASSETIPRYNASIDENSPLKMYLLYYYNNQAHGMALGNTAVAPRYMITARMNSCSFGYNQTSKNTPAYISHHNAIDAGNTSDAMEGQAINWKGGDSPASGNYAYSHRTDYIKHLGKPEGLNYGATVIGVRDDGQIWHFYYQVSKGHGRKHKDLSLKGVKEIGVG